TVKRRLHIGAEPISGRRTHFRVWAPRARRVDVVVEGGNAGSLDREEAGYFSGVLQVAAGTRYRYRLDDDERGYPDPASRFQPEGPHGASEVIDPSAFEWSDDSWRGVSIEGQVMYELHVGTFTREGTYAAAEAELPELAHAGITVVELMPLAD